MNKDANTVGQISEILCHMSLLVSKANIFFVGLKMIPNALIVTKPQIAS